MSSDSDFPRVTITSDGEATTIPLGSQELVDQFYRIAGYGINQWAHIDRTVFECFHLVLGTTEQKAAIVYYSLLSTSQRVSLTDELLQRACDAPTIKEWTELLGQMKILMPIRNILAHQPIVCVSTVQNISHIDSEKKVEIRNWLEVSIDPKELLRGRRKSRTITVEELQGHVHEVQMLHAKLLAFQSKFKASVNTAVKHDDVP